MDGMMMLLLQLRKKSNESDRWSMDFISDEKFDSLVGDESPLA